MAMLPTIDLSGQVALVTGGATGIGRAICLGLHRCGAQVVVNYSSTPDEAHALVSEIEQSGGHAIAVHADVSVPADVEAMYSRIVAEMGTLHILIGNAGVQKDAAFLHMSYADWETALKVDLSGLFLCMQAASREFVRCGVVESVSQGGRQNRLHQFGSSTHSLGGPCQLCRRQGRR